MKKLLFILLLLPGFANGQIINNMARYPIDDPSMENLHDGIIGKWKFKEDTNQSNFYEILRGAPYLSDRYHIKFWNRGGTNPTYESNLNFSKIGTIQFINMPYFEDLSDIGFFFLKILSVNADYTKITAVMVKDNMLSRLDQDELKQRITKNIDNPAYYADTVHLYKVK